MSKYKVQNTDPGSLQAKIKEASKTANKTRQQLGRAYDLFEIELNVEEPYYNIVNYRSKKECDEYTKEHNLPEDTFSKDNFFSKSSQQHYHNIIHSQVMANTSTREAYEAEFGDSKNGGKEATQTQNLYLSFDGVLANGNSRTCYWRENPPKNITTVKYWVFADGISWEEIEDAILTIDARADITQRLPWYNVADKARDRSSNISDKNELTRIAKSQQYKDAGHMNREIERLELAEKFIASASSKEFNSFKDLGKLGAGSGTQAFDTLQKGLEKTRKPKFASLISEDREFIIENCFTALSDQAKNLDSAKDVHTAVGWLFKDSHLEGLIKERTESGGDVDPITGSSPGTKPTKRKKLTITELDSELLKISEAEKHAAAIRNTEALAKNLTNENTKIKGYRILLNDKTNYQSAQKAMKDLIQTVTDLDKLINEAAEGKSK